MGLFGKSSSELSLEAKISSLEAQKESLQRENLLLRTQVSDFQALVQSLHDKAAEERASLMDRMTTLLRPSLLKKASEKASPQEFLPKYPGFRPDTRPDDPSDPHES